ncbi:MAG: PadR family transcriptional regulator [Bacteroidota bacterium]
MKGTFLGEFQELVLLAILALDEEAYGVSIQQKIKAVAGRDITRGALHSALSRLEEKGFLKSAFGAATKERGGRRKRLYSVTAAGQNALGEAKYVREAFRSEIKPSFNFG